MVLTMRPMDYLVDVGLIAIVFRQIVPRQLTLASIRVPIGLVAIAGVEYLKAFSLAGNDLVLLCCLVPSEPLSVR